MPLRSSERYAIGPQGRRCSCGSVCSVHEYATVSGSAGAIVAESSLTITITLHVTSAVVTLM